MMEDWEERFRLLIELGEALPVMPESLKTAENKVSGCVSQVWMTIGWSASQRLLLQADGDAQIVRGLIAVLLALFQGKAAEEIRAIDVKAVFRQLGLDQHLSPNRRNGFFAMVERLRALATRADK